MHLNSRLGLLEALLPGGSLASRRKVWSWYGALANGEDAGNWNYAVVMHIMFLTGLDNPGAHARLSDVLLGDVLEAILYLGHEAPQGSEAHACAIMIDLACRCLQRIGRWSASHGFWESSRDMAWLMSQFCL